MKRSASLCFLFLSLLFVMLAGDADAALDPKLYPGVRASEMTTVPYAYVKPSPKDPFSDMPDSYKDGCHAGSTQSTVRVCKYGYQSGYAYTVAVIGDSHSGHWLGAIQEFATKYKIRIIYATKSGCGLSSTYNPDYPSCNTWNKKIIPAIASYKPDLVLTKADYADSAKDEVPPGFLSKFRELNSYKLKVFAIRDTPYFTKRSGECIRMYGRNSVKCKDLRSVVLPTPSAWDKLAVKPLNVHYVDYSAKICPGKYCSPVQGNILIMRDYHHMTDSYARTFKKYLLADMLPLLREARAKRYAE